MALSNKYLSNLTPLRGVAALLTIIYHVDLMLGGGGNMLLKTKDSLLFSRLYLMVDFFFILSGFIMCHVYGELFATSVKGPSFKKFTIARFARVYPLHFVTLVYTIVLFYISGKSGIPLSPVLQIGNNGFSIFTNLLLLQSMNLHNWFSWVHASWSISVEWWAYMVFPFLVKPFMRLSAAGKALVALLCFAGYLCITFWLVPLVTIPAEIPFVKVNPAALSINVSYQFGFVRCLCGFVLGMMMYQGYKIDWAKKIVGNGYVLVALAAGSFFCMHLGLADIFAVSFFPFILLAGAYGSVGINRFFAGGAFQKLGDWSFSMYLVHQPLLFTIGSVITYLNPADPNKVPAGPPPQMGMGPGWLVCIGFIALTLMVSYCTYSLIEVPARRWINPAKK